MRKSIGTMKTSHHSLPLPLPLPIVLLIFVKYATTTSIAEEINSQIAYSRRTPTVESPTVRLYGEMVDENDAEDTADEAESSASELIEVHALPETFDSDDSRGGDASSSSGAGVPRARRRRRRRRRKRPKTSAANAQRVAPISATSADSSTPSVVADKLPKDGLHLYYTLAEDQVRKKAFKYRPSGENTADPLAPQLAPYGDGNGNGDDGYTRRRVVAKRRRRPFKKPPPVDYHPSYTLDDDDDDFNGNVDSDNEKHQSWVLAEKDRLSLQNTRLHDDLKPTAKASDSIRHTTTTATVTATATVTSTTTTTTTTPVSPFKQDDLHSLEAASDDDDGAASQDEEGNLSKRRKRPTAAAAAAVQQKAQHQNESKDTARHESPHHYQQKPVEQNVVVKVESEHRSKLVENRKELFKMRRLPPTWAILGHAKHRSSSSPSAAMKNETTVDKGPNNNEGAYNETVTDADGTRSPVLATPSTLSSTSRHRQHISYDNADSTTTAKNDRTREADDVNASVVIPVTSTSKPRFKSTPGPKPYVFDVEEKASSNTGTLAAGETDQVDGSADNLPEQTKHNGRELQKNDKEDKEQGQENSADEATTSSQLPILAYTEQTQPNDSNTSANTNDQRLAIIYVPCNRTADLLLQQHQPSNDQSWAKSSTKLNGPETTTVRKISTTRLPNAAGQMARVDDAISSVIGSPEKPKSESSSPSWLWSSSTAKPTTSLWSPSPSTSSSATSTVAEKADTVNAVVASPPPTANTNREAKRYLDATISKVKSESGKEEQTSPLLRKPYSSAGLANSAFIKPFAGSSREIVISYTSSTNSPPSLFSYHNIDSADEQISLKLDNSSYSGGGTLLHRKTFDGNTLINMSKQQQQQQQQQQQHVERKKLPLAVKSAIIISGAILALAVLGFFALLLSCKIRQAKSRMKCHRELYRDQFQSSEFRQSSRSTSPVMSKSNFNTRNFTNNNIQSTNVTASNRNYYLWQTLRKTFQYD